MNRKLSVLATSWLLMAAAGCADDEPCRNEAAALTDLIEANGSCDVDEDCRTARSFCLFEGRGDCTGAFYFNDSVSGEAFAEADGALTRCMADEEQAAICGHCGKIEQAPACIEGRCRAGAGLLE